jgi:hypothetical protein
MAERLGHLIEEHTSKHISYRRYGLLEALELSPSLWTRYNLILEGSEQSEDDTILEVGVSGISVCDFIDGGSKVCVMDIELDRVHNHQSAIQVAGNAVEIPFESDTFDHVISLATIDWLPRKDRQQAIEEFHRVAKSTVMIQTPIHDPEQGFYAKPHEQLCAKHHKKKNNSLPPWAQRKEDLGWDYPSISELVEVTDDHPEVIGYGVCNPGFFNEIKSRFELLWDDRYLRDINKKYAAVVKYRL